MTVSLTNCWEMVEPPSTMPPAAMLVTAARTMAEKSSGPCWKNLSSSMARTASIVLSRYRLIGTTTRFSPK